LEAEVERLKQHITEIEQLHREHLEEVEAASSDDCDDSSEDLDDCRRNDTLPAVCANIVFDLTEPEGERRLREMLDAGKMRLALWEFDNYLRDLIKYDPAKTDAILDELEMVRKALWNILDYQGIRLDED
jgi:hypothetical protein